MAAHAKLSPSASERWSKCPGSIRMSEGIADRESEYAAEGTAAHQLAEHCLTRGCQPHDRIGVELKAGSFTFTVDEEMADAVAIYVEFVQGLREAGTEAPEIEFEQRLDLTSLHPGMFGTGDCVAYFPESRHLVVADYKHGRGVAVEPEENSQALCYALGAAMRLHNRGVDRVDVVIVQPRCPHPKGPIRTWTTDAVSLIDWSADLSAAAKATEKPDAPLAAGDWCRFCPAAGICPALQQAALDAARADFAVDGSVLVADPAKYDTAGIARALEQAEVIETWLKRVREFAHHELEAGRAIPGWKLVPTRATRRWRDEAKAREFLSLVGVAAEDMVVSKFKSPAQMADALRAATGVTKKKADADLAPLVDKASSGTVVVPESDPRPSVAAEAARDFEGVPV